MQHAFDDDSEDWTALIGRRLERRIPLHVEVSLSVNDVTCAAVLTDISPSGAQLFVRQSVAVGDLVKILHPSFHRQAAVKWNSHHRCGVRFDQPINQPEYTELLHILDARQ